jgi:hypothetical protein
MNKLATRTFTTELISETSYGAEKIGKHESTIDLYSFTEDPDYYLIEWDIPSLDRMEEIGIWCEEGTKILRDYDGVFSMPDEVMNLLSEQGFDVSYAE